MIGVCLGNIDYGGVSPPKMGANAASSVSPSSSASSSSAMVKDTLMPKETCPVCGIQITYKNLARHIKLRHKIKYKFCHRCRKLVPSPNFEEHRSTCSEIVIDGMLAQTESVASPPSNSNDIDVDDDSKDGGVIDPADFLETGGSGVEEEDDGGNMDEDNIVAEVEGDDDDEEGELVIGEEDDDEEGAEVRKTDTFR